MKRVLLLALSLASLVPFARAGTADGTPAPAPAETQTPPPDRPEGRTNHGPGGNPERGGFRHGGGPGDGVYVEKWLETLKERNPEEFAAMQKLRQEKPEEFRSQLHLKLQEMYLLRSGLKDRPELMAALKQLKPEDRAWLLQRMQFPMNAEGGQSFRNEFRSGMPDFRNVSTPEMEQLERKAREQLRLVSDARTDDERNQAKLELRASFAELFDRGEAQRAQQAKMIEEKLLKIRQQLQDRQARRETLIDERLQDALRAGAERGKPPAAATP